MSVIKDPRSPYQAAYNASNAEKEQAYDLMIEFIERKEDFKRELLDKALVPLNNLSYSISQLAEAMSKQASRPVVNLFIDKNTEPEKIIEAIGKVNELLK